MVVSGISVQEKSPQNKKGEHPSYQRCSPKLSWVETIKALANTAHDLPTIPLNTCVVKVARNWFAIIGDIEK